MIYFTSDNHFGHANILKWSKRTFKSAQHMEDEMVKRWNSRVKPADTVIVVGDFAFLNSQERERVVNRLNGFKILVQGNHDKGTRCPKGFDLMVQQMRMTISGQKVSIKHYPLRYTGWQRVKADFQSTEFVKKFFPRWFRHAPRYLDRMPKDVGQWHIHGHTHSDQKFNGRQIHVGCDAWDCYPVPMKQIEKYIQQEEAKSENSTDQ